MILLRKERSLKFKALYQLNLDTHQAIRLYGDGPAVLDASMAERFYKFDSANKSFKELDTHSFSPSTDAMCLLQSLYRKQKKPSTK
jgi:hypothetical protein